MTDEIKPKMADGKESAETRIIEVTNLRAALAAKEAECERLREACEYVVATAYGNIHGLDLDDVVEASRLAAGHVIRALGADWARKVLEHHGHHGKLLEAALDGIDN